MSKRWEELYANALLETDEQKLADRIDAAMSVLGDSLRQLGNSPEDIRDKLWIEDALRTLRVLRKELDIATDIRDIAAEQKWVR
jgi:hypothetical protein